MLFRADRPVSIFVCGAQKGGTTSLFAHFRDHPGLSHPRAKELHFFDDDRRDWANPDYRRLESAFSRFDGDRPRYEMTPATSFWPGALERLARYNRQARLIFLLRDPVDRAFSHWRMERARGVEPLPFASAIREGRERIRLGSEDLRRHSYVERGFYAEQAERALALFPREQVLFLRSEDMARDHRATLARIARFLGIAPFPEGPARHEHRGTLPAQAPSAADRQWIAQCLRDDLPRLPALTGIDISAWPAMRELAAAPCLAGVDG